MSHVRHDLQLYDRIPKNKVYNDDRYDPDTYISIQSKVNNDPNFEEKYFQKIVADGWVELTKITDIFLYPKGRPFKYRLNGKSMSNAEYGTFRSGGWLIGRNPNDVDLDTYNKYILYKAYNGVVFPLQLKDVLSFYILSPKKEVSLFKPPFIKTNYPVYLPDPYTNIPIVVYYARDNTNLKRFINSTKYKKALASGKWNWTSTFSM